MHELHTRMSPMYIPKLVGGVNVVSVDLRALPPPAREPDRWTPRALFSCFGGVLAALSLLVAV